MVTAIWAIGLMVSLALIVAASNLREAITGGVESATAIAEAIEKLAPDRIPHPSRSITAEPGTRLAYVFTTNNGLEVGYASVLAFVETWTVWEAFAIVEGKPRCSDSWNFERVLAPGESLTAEECTEMKQRYAVTHPD
jgi:hypothetical protein